MFTQIRRVGQHAIFLAVAKQEKFGEFLEERLGDTYSWEFDSGVLRFVSDRGFVECDTYPVASIAVEPASLLWRWQPISEGEAEYFRGQVSQLFKSFGEHHQLEEFVHQEIPYQPAEDQVGQIAQLGHDVINAGYEVCGPQAVFYQARFNEAGSRLVWALANFRDANGPTEVLGPSLTEVLIKAPRVLDICDDAEWSLSGISRFYAGVECVMEHFYSERRVVATFKHASGKQQLVEVTFDELERIVNVKTQLG